MKAWRLIGNEVFEDIGLEASERFASENLSNDIMDSGELQLLCINQQSSKPFMIGFGSDS